MNATLSVSETATVETKAECKCNTIQSQTKKKRPIVVYGTTRKVATGCGNFYVTINVDENGKAFEVFANIAKKGGCASSQGEAIGRLVSLALRYNIDKKEIIDQLKGISCHQPTTDNGDSIHSCPDAIAKAIEKVLQI
jgi:ribonucleoside-diphosphate reductase alpha chain